MSNTIKKLAEVAGRLLLAYLLVFGQGVWARQEQSAKVNPEPAPKATPQPSAEKQSSAASSTKAQTGVVRHEESKNSAGVEKSSGDDQHEGIKVHGHWTIEVRNTDGKLATHTEFENALAAFGVGELASYLARTATVGQWNVGLIGDLTFYLDEPGPAAGAPNPGTVIGTLMVSAPGNGTLILSGNGTAPSSSTIISVYSEPSSCQPNLAPSTCNVASGNQTGAALGNLPPLTFATLSSPVRVAAGQTIAVTVVITFS